MIKLTINARGKVFKFQNMVVRTPRILYLTNEQMHEIEGILRCSAISPSLYTVDEIEEADIPIELFVRKPLSRRMKIKHDGPGIPVGGKMGRRLGFN